ncbi:uncharacterized protein [Coffea arabica]|uniref:Enhancer of polycomb-like protein n=1 Tax=Coffea arabica TaxID=13443 RepID=A0A6P6W7V8_COFAR|nr:uncharacterized protein LOC113730693 [Coffea arabica]
MPSVGMRRTTRVFGARVLRSGRRLWTGTGTGDGKYTKSANGDEWIELLENSGDGGGGANQRKERGRHGNEAAAKQEVRGMDVDVKVVKSAPEKVLHEGLDAENHVGKRWGVVYTRKRKCVDSSLVESSANGNKKRSIDDKRYGRQFFRKQWRKKTIQTELAEPGDSNMALMAQEESLDNARGHFLLVVFDSSCCSWYMAASFLNSILRYMRQARVGIQQLFAFLHSKAIALVYSSCGIRFLQGSNVVAERGVCVIWGTSCLVPVFAVDYSAVPYCFMYLHSRMLLHFAHLMYSVERCLVGIDDKNDNLSTLSMLTESVQASDALAASRNDYSGKTEVSVSVSVSVSNVAPTKLTGRNLQLRNGRNIQRSSFRSKRGRRPSSFGARKANGALASNLLSFRHNSNQLSPITPRHELRSWTVRHSVTNIKQVKSSLGGLKQDIDPTSCFANILVIDSDKCYREGGAIVTLEVSAEKQWHLAIKRDGVKRYSIITQSLMRACNCNRFTHAMMWGMDSGWKLEFTDKQNWSIFRDLYKKCSDRNAQVPVESFIPVPGVHEVSGYVNSGNYVRPATYISVKDDELSRALARRTANYDMDSDDEQWLNKNEFHKLLSAEEFELVIDAFERGFHSNPDDFSDETTIPNICLNVERSVLEAVHSFWVNKRKQRRASLIRIFQLYQPRRTQMIPNSVLRKKRSFKRQGSQIGRGKQRPFLKVMAAEQDAEEQQNAVLKVEEAKAAANRSEGLAVLKRQRAQQLMENADLASYKAAMALKIAELAQIAESTDNADLLLPVG